MKNKKKPFLILNLFFVFHLMNAQGFWTQKANLVGNGRQAAVGFSIGNKGYIGTGVSGGPTYYKDFWEWDPATNVWTQKADFGGTARQDAVGMSIGTKGYIGTGMSGDYNEYTLYQDFWEWDQTTNIWTQKSNFGGTARHEAVAFSIGTKGYLGTGSDGMRQNDFWEWDQVSNVWTQKANFGGTARESAVGFSICTKGYLGTGQDANGREKDFWEWDQLTNIWTQKANFEGVPRQLSAGFSIGSKGYIGTGDCYGGTNDFWEWDQDVDVWTQKTNLDGQARWAAIGFSIGTKGYIGTGSGDNYPYYKQDFWEYDPSSITSINEIRIQDLISVYSNPNDRIFIIHYENYLALGSLQLSIFTIQGKAVYKESLNDFNGVLNRQINLDNPAKGTYFIEVNSNKAIAVKKMIIE